MLRQFIIWKNNERLSVDLNDHYTQHILIEFYASVEV